MGRLTDADKFEAFVTRTNGDEKLVNGVHYVLEKKDNTLTVEVIPKDQYEARLKADMVAMLSEIQLEIEEMDSGCGWEGYRPTAQVIGLIQQKINALKENTDDN